MDLKHNNKYRTDINSNAHTQQHRNGDSIVNIRKNFEEARERQKRAALNLKTRHEEMRKRLLQQYPPRPLPRAMTITPSPQPTQKIPTPSSVPMTGPVFSNKILEKKFHTIVRHVQNNPRQIEPQTQRKLATVSPAQISTPTQAPVQTQPVFEIPSPPPAIQQKVSKPKTRFRFALIGQHIRIPHIQQSLVLFAITLVTLGIAMNGLKSIQRMIAIKDELLTKTSQALAFADAGKAQALNFNFATAQNNFTSASAQFSQAQQQLSDVGIIVNQLVNILPTQLVKESGKDLLASGEALSNAGKELSLAANIITNDLSLSDHVDLKETFIKQLTSKEAAQMSDPASPETQTTSKKPATEVLSSATTHLDTAIKEIELAQAHMKKVNPTILPQSIKEQFTRINDFTNKIHASLTTGSELSHFFLAIIGNKKEKRYLVTFHNNNEMRADFGFIGTYALVDMDQGNVTHIEVDDIYNLDGQLKEKVNPPEPIAHLTPRWYLHDANYFLDFPTSAKTMEWFFEKAGGPTVDGVFSLTPGIIQEMLTITGPIEMPEYNTTITSENFIAQTQQEVENEYDRQLNRPKKFLADLAPKLLTKLFEDKQALQKILPIIQKSLSEKQMGMFFFDEELQKKASEYNWTGEVKQTDKDYLAIADNNIGGGKTDLLINSDIHEEIMIQDDGSVIKKLTITRAHTGKKVGFSVKNIDWMKIYVPKGSVLLSAKGFEPIHTVEKNSDYINNPLILQQETNSTLNVESGTRIMEESGKTVFGNWTSVEPQQSTIVEITYRLPFSIQLAKGFTRAQTYSLLLQKQPGSKDHAHTLTITYPASMKPQFLYPTGVEHDQAQRKTIIKNNITQDQYAAVTFVHK